MNYGIVSQKRYTSDTERGHRLSLALGCVKTGPCKHRVEDGKYWISLTPANSEETVLPLKVPRVLSLLFLTAESRAHYGAVKHQGRLRMAVYITQIY